MLGRVAGPHTVVTPTDCDAVSLSLSLSLSLFYTEPDWASAGAKLSGPFAACGIPVVFFFFLSVCLCVCVLACVCVCVCAIECASVCRFSFIISSSL